MRAIKRINEMIPLMTGIRKPSEGKDTGKQFISGLQRFANERSIDMNMTHPDILKAERFGVEEVKTEPKRCPICASIVEDIETCSGCLTKCCAECSVAIHEVLYCCEECFDDTLAEAALMTEHSGSQEDLSHYLDLRGRE